MYIESSVDDKASCEVLPRGCGLGLYSDTVCTYIASNFAIVLESVVLIKFYLPTQSLAV